MTGMISHRLLRVYGLATLLALLATPLLADGTQTGTIAGLVVDPDGNAVQGITVEVTGPQIRRQIVSTAAGRFRFLALGVGSYRVTADLLGMQAATTVEVTVDRTSELRLALRRAGDGVEGTADEIHDAIRVVAEAPLVDRYSTRVGTSVRFGFLEELPVQRFYQSVALMSPGLSETGSGNPNTAGALRSHNLYLVDGVDTSDPTTGLFGLNLTYEAIDEVEVTTAAVPAQYGRASGAVINVVTRSGTRNFEGLARWVATNPSWNSERAYPDDLVPHLQPEIRAANQGPEGLQSNLSLSLGGPVIKERLFGFAAWENGERSRLRPTAFAQAWQQKVEGRRSAFKLSWQSEERHTVVAQYTDETLDFNDFAPFSLEPAENSLPNLPPGSFLDPSIGSRPGEIFAIEQRSQEGSFSKLAWDFIPSQNLSLSLHLAEQDRRLTRAGGASRGLTNNAPHLGLILDEDGDPEQIYFMNGITEEGEERRPRQQLSLASNFFLAIGSTDHELSAGMDLQRTESFTGLQIPGLDGIDPATGRPVAGQFFLDADLRAPCLEDDDCQPFDPETGAFQPWVLWAFYRRPEHETRVETDALYMSDTLTLNRWLIRAGLRWERVRGEDRHGTQLLDDAAVAPRIAVTYTPLDEGNLLLSASWSRYHEPILQKALDPFGLGEPLSAYSQYLWAGLPGGLPQCVDEDPTDLTSPCWLFDFSEGAERLQPAQPNPGLRRAAVDELTFGFQRRLGPGGALRLHYVDRTWDDLWDDVLQLVDFETFEVSYEVRNLPRAQRSYEAVQLQVQKTAPHWDLLASYTWSRTEGNLFRNDGFDSYGDFSEISDLNLINRQGPAPYDRPHQISAYGSYRFFFRRFDLVLASALEYRDGVPWQFVTDRDLGERYLTPRGSQRLSGALRLDLAVNLALRFGEDLELELKAEALNLSDENSQLGAESLVDTGIVGLPRSLADLQAPRAYRLTLGLRF